MKKVYNSLFIIVNRHVFVHGPEAIELDGRSGSRYWIYKYTEFFPKQKPLNDRLSGFPFAIFPGAGRHPSQCPIVFLVQVCLKILFQFRELVHLTNGIHF